MPKDEKATLFIILISLMFVMAVIFVGSEKQVSLSFKAGDVLDYPVININKISNKNLTTLLIAHMFLQTANHTHSPPYQQHVRSLPLTISE